jgi:hypothetical protein
LWFELLSEFLLDELGFRRLALDRCCFLLVAGTLRVIIVLYVDDMLIMGDQSLQAQVVERIRSKFKVTEGGCDFLGLHIEHDLARGTLKVHQQAFAEALVKSTGYADSKPVPTPLPTDFTAADPDPPEDAKDGPKLDFPSVVGSIGWLATHAMPVLMYAFSVLAVVCRPTTAEPNAPRRVHQKALARVLRWVAANTDAGLTYHRKNRYHIDVYVDASHGREPHSSAALYCNSRSGGFLLANGTCVGAMSSKQKFTAISTFEAEAPFAIYPPSLLTIIL